MEREGDSAVPILMESVAATGRVAEDERRGVRSAPLEQGDLVVFPNEIRPEPSALRHGKVNVRHGVSEVRDGERTALGLIMHNAVG